MTLQKQIDDLNRNNNLIISSPALISIKRLKAILPEYVQIGPTSGGLEISFDTKLEYFGDDGTTGPVGAMVTDEEVLLKFSLSQAGIFSLALAMNCNDEDHIEITQPAPDPASDGFALLQLGGRRDLEQYEIKAQIRTLSGLKIREYVFFKAIPEPDFIHRHVDDDQTLVECRFKLLIDQTRDEGKRYFSVTDYYDSESEISQAPNY